MRVKELRIENYKIFKTINILFNDNVNIFVGENDSGKTTILETLSDFLNLNSIEAFEYIKYEINGEIYKIIPNNTNPQFGFHKRIKESDGSEITITSNKHNRRDSIDADEFDVVHIVRLVLVLLLNL